MQAMTVRPDAVRTFDGKFYVACKCSRRNFLGAYGAAKLGQYELHSACEQCGRKITIERGITDED